jgi:hypothetical protein
VEGQAEQLQEMQEMVELVLLQEKAVVDQLIRQV